MLTLCAAVLALAVEASPAEARFTFQGKVLDSTRAPIAAAQVTAVPEDDGTPVSTRTDAEGNFASISAPVATRSGSSPTCSGTRCSKCAPVPRAPNRASSS
jgi:hypothetical protein